MNVKLRPDQMARLDQLASATGQSVENLVREAVDNLLAHHAWFTEQVQVGLDQIERGETLLDEALRARLEKRFPR